MNETERKRIEEEVAAYVASHRPPAHLRDQIDLGFRFDGKSIEIFEISPGIDDADERMENAVAKAKYVKLEDRWLIYWQKSDQKWHKYEPMPQVKTVAEFLEVIDDDEYACFFG